jgi:hypothetical protein
LVKLGTEAISKTAAVAEAGYAARGGNEISTVTDTTWNVNTITAVVGLIIAGLGLYAVAR